MTYSLAIHGGAGTILRSQITQEDEVKYNHALHDALVAGNDVLIKGGSAVDAVAASVVSLENCPLFNAGKGSVFSNEWKHEMDASIMDGTNLQAGAVSMLHNVKNPVLLAKEIMQKSEHVYLCGEGAERYAHQQGLSFEPDEYFFTHLRKEQLEEALRDNKIMLDHRTAKDRKFGTVGAVAKDIHGNIAAATSTGGMTNKKFNRIGDSPIIGAGTYANNHTCAVSCTGHGEYFIRGVVAYDVSCLMEYKGMSLMQACEKVILEKQVKLGGEGGLIAVDNAGNLALIFNSEGMYRGYVTEKKDFMTDIYK